MTLSIRSKKRISRGSKLTINARKLNLSKSKYSIP
ncbi:hypothetical protein T4C_6475 [Trichinella pseudospiralis]|uniref:Uncharacterized protein n=1 Tax=Trichinella pseudospiralis TaxID=6337 RepID=A0A0V1GEA9_TRIPS|nr:hypothetical protein T4C_4696 [Trichinella pseudospiralis]KRY96631.1 hypothetical protein T4C_6475 [Trichinella pseudospiralis]